MRISDWSSDVCSSDLRGRGIEAEPARKRVDPIECERSPPDDRPDIADQIARPPGGLPARGNGFQEIDIGHVVHREDRRLTPVGWRLQWPQPGQKRHGALRASAIGDEATAMQFLHRAVLQLTKKDS